MKIDKLIFFNHYRNGDCFINKQYVRQIISKIKPKDVYYAHNNHESVTQDLPIQLLRIDQLPRELRDHIKIAYDEDTNTLFLNTWVGTAVPKHFNWGQHPNFVTLHAIWLDIFKGLNLTLDGNYYDNLPVLDFSKYDLKRADNWINNHIERDFVLICNGKHQSDQSSMGDMANIISNLSTTYRHVNFVVCDKLDIRNDNIFYTDDIFDGPVGNLPQISYLSHHAKLIVGKNSGPFSFAHTYSNNSNPKQTFICFSKVMEHCLAGDGKYYAEHLFSDTTDDQIATNIISQSIEKFGEYYDIGVRKIKHVYHN